MQLAKPIGPGRRPRFEAVVPCYNYGAFLPDCVRSLLDQPGLDVRVTIVDDASTDGSGAIADALAEADSRVRVLHNAQNLGMVGTFNRGIAQVDSDYMLLISADDMVAPGALVRGAAVLEHHPRVGLVYGHAQKFTVAPRVRREPPVVSWSVWQGSEWIEMQLLRSWSNISSPEAIVRTSVQHAVGPYDPGLRHTLDVEMWLRIAAVSDVAHINGVDQAYYRRQADSHSTQFGRYQDIEERWRAYDQFLRGWDRPAHARQLRPVIQQNLAAEALRALADELEEAATGEVPAHATTVLALAERIRPGVLRSPVAADVLTLVGGEPPRGPGAAARRARRELARASRWHRWHRVRPLG